MDVGTELLAQITPNTMYYQTAQVMLNAAEPGAFLGLHKVVAHVIVTVQEVGHCSTFTTL